MTAHPGQDAGLTCRLHPFGHQLQPQAVAHGDDGLHQAVAAGAVLDVHDEGAVDLERVERELGQVAERGIAGAEVVQRHAHAQRPQPRQHGAHVGAVVDQHPFRQLQFQHRAGQAVAAQRRFHQGREAGIGQLPGRHVDADPHPVERAAAPQGRLAARLLQHPAAQFDDQAAVLGHRDETVRRHRPQGGAVPAQQGFDLAHPAAAGLRDDLVCKPEFAGPDGLAQGAVDHQRVAGGRVHGVAEKAQLAPARLLGLVHGDVGVAQQGVAVRAVARIAGQADAGRHGHRVVRQVEARPHGRQDAFGASLGRRATVALKVGQHGDELVAAEAGQHVLRPQQRLQAPGHLAQQLVAGAVAERIVDALELVEVDEQQRAGAPGRAGPGDVLLQPGRQGVAVAQARDGIDPGRLVQQGVLLLAFGNVEQLHQAIQPAPLDVGRGHHLHRQLAAVVQGQLGLLGHGEAGAGRFQGGEIVVGHLARQARQQVRHVAPDQVGRTRVAQQAGAAFVGHVDIAAPVADEETVAQAVDGAGVAQLDLVLDGVDQAQHGQRLEHGAGGEPVQIGLRHHGHAAGRVEQAAQHHDDAQQAVAVHVAAPSQAHAGPHHDQAQQGAAGRQHDALVVGPPQLQRAGQQQEAQQRQGALAPAQAAQEELGAGPVTGHATRQQQRAQRTAQRLQRRQAGKPQHDAAHDGQLAHGPVQGMAFLALHQPQEDQDGAQDGIGHHRDVSVLAGVRTTHLSLPLRSRPPCAAPG